MNVTMELIIVRTTLHVQMQMVPIRVHATMDTPGMVSVVQVTLIKRFLLLYQIPLLLLLFCCESTIWFQNERRNCIIRDLQTSGLIKEISANSVSIQKLNG